MGGHFCRIPLIRILYGRINPWLVLVLRIPQ
jgi:hypothetical protein